MFTGHIIIPKGKDGETGWPRFEFKFQGFLFFLTLDFFTISSTGIKQTSIGTRQQ